MNAKILKLHLLGRPLIELDSEPVEGFVSEKALALLGYLALQRGNLARQRLAGLFWGDMPGERARANLRICQLVDGLPLGIELAAAGIGHHSCQEIAAQIEQGIDALAATWRNAPRRHRSLRAVFDHSWSLLPPEAQRALRQVSVFRGGFTVQAAKKVCGASQETVYDLVDRSMLRWSEPRQGSKRFDLHELLRQYAYERLVEAGDEQTACDRHLDFFLNLAKTARPGLDGGEAQAWLERLEDELDNLRAALDWSLLHEENPLAGLRLAAALAEFWGRRGYLSEGRARLDALLEKMNVNTDSQDRPSVSIRSRSLCAAGDLALLQGDLAEAHTRFEAGLSLSQASGDQEITAAALLGLGTIAWTQSNFGLAQNHFERSLYLYRKVRRHARLRGSPTPAWPYLTHPGTICPGRRLLQTKPGAVQENRRPARPGANIRRPGSTRPGSGRPRTGSIPG
jgi:tetratricopeptide (TPR) repeat protein